MPQIKINLVFRRLLEDRKTTVTKVSRATGISKSTLSTFLLPTARPTNVEQIKMLADHLGVGMSELLFDKPESMKSFLDSLKTEMAVEGLFKLRLERVIIHGSEGEEK